MEKLPDARHSDVSHDAVADLKTLLKIDQNGGPVHVLYEPDGSDSTSFDVIAIHGTGRWDVSWACGIEPFLQIWLKDALPTRLPTCRIIAYECDDLERDVSQRNATDLLEVLMGNRDLNNRSQTPVIFLCMGFGGSLIKQLMISTQQSESADVRDFGRLVRGLVFFGTPQNAQVQSKIQKSLTPHYLLAWMVGMGARERSLRATYKAVPWINHDFEGLRLDDVQCVCFYDTANVIDPDDGKKDLGAPLIGESIATFQSGRGENIPLHADFSRAVKFKSIDDPNLLTVLDALRALYDRALHSVDGHCTNVGLKSR